MPNWCLNQLKVTGEKPEVLRFVQQAEGPSSVLVFDNFVPMPKTKENTEGEGWYDWCLAQWGTKWDASDIDRITEHGSFAIYEFNTAWSPPIPWLEAVFPDVRFVHMSRDWRGVVNSTSPWVCGSRRRVAGRMGLGYPSLACRIQARAR